MTDAIAKRQNSEMDLLIEQLKTVPIIQICCKKSGISRATFYRWKKESPDFSKQADEAMKEGQKLVNDIAESKLLALIQDGNLTAIMYWLNHRHSGFATKVEITANSKRFEDEHLTPEQNELLKKALEMVSLTSVKLEAPKPKSNE